VIILGSEGQIGRSLVSCLTESFTVDSIDIQISNDHDLRNMETLKKNEDILRAADYLIFLAFDVGGARYLSKNQNQFIFLENNTNIMLNVFSFLSRNPKKFIFASSEMALDINSPYGVLKALGEDFTKSLDGIFVRFWNVFDYEKDKSKAHVITDFVDQALDFGKINMLTDGSENRQFLHSSDCARAIQVVIENYEKLIESDGIDISSFHTTTIKEVGNIIAHLTNSSLSSGKFSDLTRNGEIILPRQDFLNYWRPTVPLKTGIEMVLSKAIKVRSL
jgi:nucleoside-diphosphate-sugar epimerase